MKIANLIDIYNTRTKCHWNYVKLCDELNMFYTINNPEHNAYTQKWYIIKNCVKTDWKQ